MYKIYISSDKVKLSPHQHKPLLADSSSDNIYLLIPTLPLNSFATHLHLSTSFYAVSDFVCAFLYPWESLLLLSLPWFLMCAHEVLLVPQAF